MRINENNPLGSAEYKINADQPEENLLHEIESDGDTLEPETFGTDVGTVDVSDPKSLEYWSDQFQISKDELKATVLLRGNSIAEIKRFLSV